MSIEATLRIDRHNGLVLLEGMDCRTIEEALPPDGSRVTVSSRSDIQTRTEYRRLLDELAQAKSELDATKSDLAKAILDLDRYIARVKLLENRLDAIRGIVR